MRERMEAMSNLAGGLGRELVAMHGASIEVKGGVGKGSRFTVRLPSEGIRKQKVK